MKKIFLSLAFIFIVGNGLTIAQDNIVSVEPIRLWSGLRLKYERVLTERFTAGTQATLYYGSYPGYQIAPFAKYYFKANAPEGFYALAKLPLGMFRPKEIKEYSFNGGLGLGVGWQMLFGKKNNWALDFNMGVKFVSPVGNNDSGDIADAVKTVGWYFTGPGSIFDCLLTFGYRF